MNTKFFALALVAVILSFAAGFYIANQLNRNELMMLRGENENLKKSNTQKPAADPSTNLSDDEIRAKIAEADKDPTNFDFQKKLGVALFSYGAMKQNQELISESARLLQRVYDHDPKDFDVLVTLGNAHYDLASLNKTADGFKKARDFYAKALEIKPDDANVRADYGSTYLFSEPAEPEKAAPELLKALQTNPKNERALQFATETMLKLGKKDEAKKYLEQLKTVNRQNPMIPEFETGLAGGASNQK
ncbi:MAG: hypothetical protein JSS81_09250 [Acidobacteria bacterium]|nr:hypothetical protein [Acidobacteriota bacterium]